MLFSHLEIGDYGLVYGLNPIFYVALIIVVLSFFLTIKKNPNNTILILLHLISLVSFLALVPLLLEGTPRFPYNFESARSIDYIIQNGFSSSENIEYQSWPGIFYYGTFFSLVVGISLKNLLIINPFIFLIIDMFILFLIYSTFLNRREVWAAFLIGNTIYFTPALYFVPGTLGALMILFALMIILRFEILDKRSSMAIKLLFVIFSLAAVISHFLSSLYLFMALFFFFLLSLIYKKQVSQAFLMVFVFIAAFQIYVAGSYSLDVISRSILQAFDLESIFFLTQGMGYSGSQAHADLVNLRIISALILSALALTGFAYEFFIQKKRSFKTVLLPTWLVANSSMTLVTAYSGEIISRTFSASSGILNMLAAKMIENKYLSYILLLFIIILSPLTVFIAYGNEAVDYVSPAEISGSTFLHTYSPEKSVVRSLIPRAWSAHYSSNLEWQNLKYSPINLTETIDWDSYLSGSIKEVYNDIYIAINDQDIDHYLFTLGPVNRESLKSITNSTYFEKVYDNQGFSLYLAVK